MMRGFLGVVLALALAVPGTSRAVSLVLTPEGGDPTSDGITDVLHGDVVSGGLFVFDVYLDIGATFGDQPNQAYADSLSFSTIFSYQFVIQANTALGVSFSDQGCTPGFSGYCPLGHDGSQPVWFSQVFRGDAGFVVWNDSLFANAGFSPAVPFNIAGTGGFRPGLLQLGSLFVDIAPNELLQGSLILTLVSDGSTFIDGGLAGRSKPATRSILVVFPEPSPSLLLGVSLAALILARRRRSRGRRSTHPPG